jgi:hypothetical protein
MLSILSLMKFDDQNRQAIAWWDRHLACPQKQAGSLFYLRIPELGRQNSSGARIYER